MRPNLAPRRGQGEEKVTMQFSKSRALAAPLACGLALSLAACGGDRAAMPGRVSIAPADVLGQSQYAVDAPTDYRLGPNDAVQIKVYGEPDLSFDKVFVNQRGTISFPFAGEVRASGLTTAELAQQIARGLGRHVLQPQVAVNLVEYGSQRIVVEGSVARSGVFVVPPGTTLLGALAMAGEPDKLARVKEIAVFRTDAQGRSVALFDLRQVRAGKMIDPVLQGNDRVVVGMSGSSRAYQDLLSLVPVFALFTRF